MLVGKYVRKSHDMIVSANTSPERGTMTTHKNEDDEKHNSRHSWRRDDIYSGGKAEHLAHGYLLM